MQSLWTHSSGCEGTWQPSRQRQGFPRACCQQHHSRGHQAHQASLLVRRQPTGHQGTPLPSSSSKTVRLCLPAHAYLPEQDQCNPARACSVSRRGHVRRRQVAARPSCSSRRCSPWREGTSRRRASASACAGTSSRRRRPRRATRPTSAAGWARSAAPRCRGRLILNIAKRVAPGVYEEGSRHNLVLPCHDRAPAASAWGTAPRPRGATRRASRTWSAAPR